MPETSPEVREVAPNRIYIAGSHSAGTLALLFTQHDRRIQACIAVEPHYDIPAEWKKQADAYEAALPGCRDFMYRISPISHVKDLQRPCLLFHARRRVTQFPEAKRFLWVYRRVTHLPNKLITMRSANVNLLGTFAAATTLSAVRWLKTLDASLLLRSGGSMHGSAAR